jgi:hypothetical protein
MIGVQVPAGAGNFSLRHRVQTGSGAHPASNPMGNRGCFPGSKAIVPLITTHLHLAPRLKMGGVIPPLPHYVFLGRCLVKDRICLHNIVFS